MAALTCRKAPVWGWNTIGISSWRIAPTARCTSEGTVHLECGAQVAWRHEAWPNWRGCCAQLIGYTQPPATLARSEEHTSELQSRLHLVCRLLLEKKKKNLKILKTKKKKKKYKKNKNQKKKK